MEEQDAKFEASGQTEDQTGRNLSVCQLINESNEQLLIQFVIHHVKQQH